MRPIDADALYDKAETWYKGAPIPYRQIYRSFVDIIADAPTITPPPNDPLTMDELLEMDGEPIYAQWVRSNRQMGGEWAFVCLKWKVCKTEDGGAMFFDRYGEWWIAYRRKPEDKT